MESRLFNMDDDFTENFFTDINRRVEEIKANDEECHHCKNKAQGVAVIRAIVFKDNRKEVHITTVAVCRHHGQPSAKTQKKNYKIALECVLEYYGSFDDVEFHKV